ncbi:Sodium/potassium/calcium exchanger 6 [Echinococcus granulosus]|uniref:Sodium/potassium/calcium exchanger 6 n=1 Tax=Echinococcus granulosus TaxID=6210 RepID=W6UZG5_ECHGR|nr:Sodium/potassium/calcium exchanger 6 [Echinococcus granulosus]EUB59029.1 Sodium/potassium/calcium exchanger 6 [Echinococcus granulosus]
MRQRTVSAVAASVLCARIKRHRGIALAPSFHTLLISILVVGCAQVAIASPPSAFSDVMGVSRSFPPSGDAPNSSVCRHALKQVSGHSAKCNISRDFRGCRFDSGFISYLEFQYCQFSTPVVPTILMGVTLLAFGNGAPDVFSAVTAITTGDPEAPDEGLGLGFLMVWTTRETTTILCFANLGSGLLVNTVTAGLIMIIHPFQTNRRPFIKDVLFYMSAVSWSASILIRRSIYLSDSIGFILLYILYVITTWAASHIHLKRSNSPIYQRCANYLKGLKKCTICKRNKPTSRSPVEGDETSSPKDAWWFRSLCGLIRSRRTVSESLVSDDFELGSKKSNALQDNHMGGQNEHSYVENDVKIISYRKHPDPMSISKGASHNGDRRRSSRIFPRIEVTAPPTDNHTAVGESSTTSKTSASILRGHVAPSQDLLEPPHRVHHLLHPLTPPPHYATKCITPPSSVSQRSSVRKRASVGGIGLRSRTPSIYQRRGSRRMSAMEQLPFVVRWIIASEETEGKDTEDENLEIRRRHRNASDSTHAGDLVSFHTFAQDISQSRSPTVSFRDDPSSHCYFPHFPPTHELQRISSASLNGLDDIDKARSAQAHSPADFGSTFTISTKGKRGICGKIAPKIGEGETELQAEDEEKEEAVEDPFVRWASRGMWHHLLYCLCPIEISEWNDLSIPVKLLQIIQSPIFILFRLTIPVVYEDLEPTSTSTPESATDVSGAEGINLSSSTYVGREGGEQMQARSPKNSSQTVNERGDELRSGLDSPLVDFEDLHGWCRLLNCFQCLITPMLWVLLITVGGIPLGLYKVGNSNLPVVVIVLLISTGLTITIFVTSSWDRAPTPYHRPFFATLGFLTSIVWIYAIAHELVNSLEALGIVWEISEAILGITVMAFASSISDLMSNSLLAHNGYPRIAFAACIGSPLFNLLIGAGASYTIKLARSGDHTADMSFTLTHVLLFSFLMGVLTTNLVVAFATGFHMRRVYGICLLCAYATFMMLAILVEADVIEPPTSWHLLTGTE